MAPVVKNKKQVSSVAIIGDGPVSLMTLSELIDKAEQPLSITVICQKPKDKFGFGAISDTELEGAFANVLAKKMSIDPAKSGEGHFTLYLKEIGLDKATWQEARSSAAHDKFTTAGFDTEETWQKMKDWITRFNADESKIADQYIPRSLLHGMIEEFAVETERKATAKGIEVHYTHGNAIDINQDKGGVRIDVEAAGGKPSAPVIADVAAVTIGLPQSKLPGETSIKNGGLICSDVHHPASGNALHAETAGKKGNIVLVGSGLTAVDAVMGLEKKGFFKDKENTVTVVSPGGKFPYPHELTPSAAYDGAFLKSENAPERLKTSASAKDLSDAVILSALHATGAKWYEEQGSMKFSIPAHNRTESEAVARLTAEGELILDTASPAERDQLKKVFAAEGKETNNTHYNWQAVIDHFRNQMPQKWQEFSETEKESWVGHYSKIWGDFRNRVPANISDTLQELRENGQVIMSKGRVQNISENGGEIAVRTESGIVRGNEVINATGWGSPDRDSPLLSAMRSHNAVTINRTEGVKSQIPELVMIGQNDGNPRAISATGWTELRPAASKGAEAVLKELSRQSDKGWQKSVQRNDGARHQL